MDVQLPDGTTVKDVPDGTTKAQLAEKLTKNGMNVPKEWLATSPDDQHSAEEYETPAQKQVKDNERINKEGRRKQTHDNYLQKIEQQKGRTAEADEGLGEKLYGLASAGARAGLSAIASPLQAGLDLVHADKANEAIDKQVANATPLNKAGERYLGAATDVLNESGVQGLAPEFSKAPHLASEAGTTLRSGSEAAKELAGDVKKANAATGAVIKGVNPEVAAAQAIKENVLKAPDKIAAPQTQAEKMAAQGSEMGYKVLPSKVNPTGTTKALEAVSGKRRLSQDLATQNQEITDNAARRELALQPEEHLSRETIEAVREKAGAEGYEPVKSIAEPMKATKEYLQSVQRIGDAALRLKEKFPNTVKVDEAAVRALQQDLSVPQMSASDAVELTKILRRQSRDLLNKPESTSAEKVMGRTYKRMSDAIENMVDANLAQDPAKADVLQNFRDARKRIAISHTVEKALTGDGHVDATKLAGELKRKKPLSGDLKKAAEFAEAFPKENLPPQRTTQGVADYHGISDMVARTATALPRMFVGSKVGQKMLGVPSKVQAEPAPLKPAPRELELQQESAFPPKAAPEVPRPATNDHLLSAEQSPFNTAAEKQSPFRPGGIEYPILEQEGGAVQKSGAKAENLPRLTLAEPGGVDFYNTHKPEPKAPNTNDHLLSLQDKPKPRLELTSLKEKGHRYRDIEPENTINFKLRQELLDEPANVEAVNAWRAEDTRLQQIVDNAINPNVKEKARQKQAQLREDFAKVAKPFGINNAADAHGLSRKIYQSDEGTQLPVQKTYDPREAQQ